MQRYIFFLRKTNFWRIFFQSSSNSFLLVSLSPIFLSVMMSRNISARQNKIKPKNIILPVFVNCLFECLCDEMLVELFVFLATPHIQDNEWDKIFEAI